MSQLITVCIPTRLRNTKYLIELLLSISKQKMLPDETLIIVNDKNKTRKMLYEIIENIVDEIPKNINHRFIVSDKGGLSIARNLGIDHCKNEILLFSDDDDIWHEEKISTIYDLISNNGTCLIRHRFNEMHGKTIKRSPSRYNLKPNIFLVGIGNIVGGGSSFCGSTSIFKTLKYNENLISCEDWDFWIRAYLANVSVIECTKELVSYRYHNERMTKSFFNIFGFESYVRFKISFMVILLLIGLGLGFIKSSIRFLFIDSYNLISYKLNK